jgi:hypothetical protein
MNTSHFNVGYDNEHHIVKVAMNGFLSHEVYKHGWTSVLELIKHHRPHRILVAIEDGKIISPENQHWLMEHYIPELEKLMHGKQVRQARIVHGDYFNKLSVSSISNQIKSHHLPLEIKDFENEKSALEWLMAV